MRNLEISFKSAAEVRAPLAHARELSLANPLIDARRATILLKCVHDKVESAAFWAVDKRAVEVSKAASDAEAEAIKAKPVEVKLTIDTAYVLECMGERPSYSYYNRFVKSVEPTVKAVGAAVKEALLTAEHTDVAVDVAFESTPNGKDECCLYAKISISFVF